MHANSARNKKDPTCLFDKLDPFMQFAETCDRVTTLLQNRLTPAFSPSINWRDNGPTTIVLLVLDYEKLPNHLQQLGERLAATAVFLNSHTTYSFVQHFSSNKDILTESTDKSRQLCGKDEQNWLLSSTIALNSYHILLLAYCSW